MMGRLTAPSMTIKVSVDSSKAGGIVTARQGWRAAAGSLRSGSNGPAQAESESQERVGSTDVSVVLPSSYALLDLATAAVLDALRDGAVLLDKVPIIRKRRDDAHSVASALSLDADSSTATASSSQGIGKRATAGDTISIDIPTPSQAACTIRTDAGGWPGAEQSPQSMKLPGLIVAVFHVDGEVSWPRACKACLLYTSPSPRDKRQSRMPSSA